MRDYTYNASLKGSTVATINELTAEDIDRYLKTGKTDEKYTDLLLNFLLINDNYELQRCDIFVPYEDHITYLISTDDETIGESLNKTASYYGEEKNLYRRLWKYRRIQNLFRKNQRERVSTRIMSRTASS